MSLLAQTIGQIFEIEFCHISPFWAFFTLKSDSTYPRFKFSDLVLYWAYDRGPKNFGLMGSYIWIPYSNCDQGEEFGVDSRKKYLADAVKVHQELLAISL